MHTQNNNHIGLPENETDMDITADLPEELVRTAMELSTTGYVRNGKIARLPEAVRKIVNQMLDDNRTYPQVIARLAELGHTGIRPQNLSEWRKGGYQDWLRFKQELEFFKLDHQRAAASIANPDAVDPAKTSHILLSMRLQRILTETMDRPLEELISLRFFKLARLVGRQMEDATRRERLEFERQRRAASNPTTRQQ